MDQRPRDSVVDPKCAGDAASKVAGECRDACWVDEDGGVHFDEEQYTTSTATPDRRCHDGGLRAVSNKCPYGTQATRCGPARPVAYTKTLPRRLSEEWLDEPLSTPASSLHVAGRAVHLMSCRKNGQKTISSRRSWSTRNSTTGAQSALDA